MWRTFFRLLMPRASQPATRHILPPPAFRLPRAQAPAYHVLMAAALRGEFSSFVGARHVGTRTQTRGGALPRAFRRSGVTLLIDRGPDVTRVVSRRGSELRVRGVE